MYEIIKEKKSLGFVEALTYIKERDGVYEICSQHEAQGIAVNGVPYSLLGVGELAGREAVIAIERDTGTVITEKTGVSEILFVSAAERGEVDTVTAGEHIELFLPWATNTSYNVGNIRTYGDKLYRCAQAHTSQADWTPDVVAALWVMIADPSVEFPPWSQPLGAHDAYGFGSKVSYLEEKWVSDIDGNIYAPGVFGWSIYVEPAEKGGEKINA